jgi:prepilin-type N-terminal cleavage/methylation domain-containing protein
MNDKGFTLIESLICVALLGLIAVAGSSMISTSIEGHDRVGGQSDIYQEGVLIMDRLTGQIRRCTHLYIPNAHKKKRSIVAVSGFVNEDNDYYFNDPLFPRIDEDTHGDMEDDGASGIAGIDDDGDGSVDEGLGNEDSDEDGVLSDDPLDGIDNDGDGNVDEDHDRDHNADGAPGIALMDDNADGTVDNGAAFWDDDEDGTSNEDAYNPLIYSFLSGTSILQVSNTYTGETKVLSTRVELFEATYEGPPSNPVRVKLKLILTDDYGESVPFFEYAFPENTYQRTGKRVR